MKRKKKAKALKASSKKKKKKSKAVKKPLIKKVKPKAKLKAAKRSPLGTRYFLVQPSTTGELAHAVSVSALEAVTAFVRAKVRLGLAQVIDAERRLVMTVNGAWAKLDEGARKEDPRVFAEFTKANPPELKVNTEAPAPVIAPQVVTKEEILAKDVSQPDIAAEPAAVLQPVPPPSPLQGATVVPPPDDAVNPYIPQAARETSGQKAGLF
jgi:hypothetical protein